MRRFPFSSSLLMTHLLVWAALVGWTGCREPDPRPPNIVLILADDLGYETLGANGGTSYATPNLDALAAGGMRFSQAYATPLCTPTRVQLMTGLYNFRNYIGFGLLDSTQVTFAQVLRDAGYRTAVVGKWQLYGNRTQRELFGRTGTLPSQAGFERSVLWQVRDRYGSRFKDPFLEIDEAPVEQLEGDYGPAVFAREAMAFLEAHRSEPFLLYYPMALTHAPFRATPDSPDYAFLDPETAGSDTAYFASNVAYMDNVVGSIVAKLDELGLREQTLVLFAGDNGTDRQVVSRLDGHLIQGDKGHTTTAGTHVPLIASMPGVVPSGAVNDHLIDFTDFFPTLLEAARLGPPPGLELDGLSFYAQLAGNPDTVRSWIFCDYAPQWGGFPNARYAQTTAWKWYDDGRLYHLVDDVAENRPLPIEGLQGADKNAVQELQAVLDRYR